MSALMVGGGVAVAIAVLALAARRRRPEPSLRSRLLAAHIAQATTRR
jgi:hypothetical protein